MAAFEMRTAKSGEYYFRLQGDNGQTVLSSEMYKAKDSCKNGVESVKKNAGTAERFEKRSATSGAPYFVLKAANHEIIGTSEQYSDESARDKGIATVMRIVASATVNDKTSS